MSANKYKGECGLNIMRTVLIIFTISDSGFLNIESGDGLESRSLLDTYSNCSSIFHLNLSNMSMMSLVQSISVCH